MKCCAKKITSLSIATLFVVAVFATVTYAQNDGNSTINNSTVNNSTDDTNLLINGNFTSGSTLADYWVMENNVSGNVKCVTTLNMQSICYRGQSGDDGTKKMKIYQAPVTGVTAGDKIRFSMLVSGNVTSSPTLIGIGAFNSSKKWLGESNAYIDVSYTPKLYEVTYVCPQNTDYVAAYLVCQKISQSTIIDISLQRAVLIPVPN